MLLTECQDKAKIDGRNAKFIAHFSAGTKVCKFIDPDFGFFMIEPDKTIVNIGFIKVDDIMKIIPELRCEYLGV